MNRYDLSGKTAIVTGGAGGIGVAVASSMLAAGVRVSLWDRAADRLRDMAAQFAQRVGASDRIATRVADVTDPASIEAAVAADLAAFGRLDVLVNNAGILGPVCPTWECDPAEFRRVLEVNLTGCFLCLRAVIKVMRRQAARPHRGHVINVASIQGQEGMARAGAYSAAKAGLIALTKSAAKELALEKIFVNCITPAAAETAMAREITDRRRRDILGRIPMGRFVEVREIATMVTWLASADCSFSTGAVFDISGGRATY
ncbi:MAG: SDR family NAD(P)-dependent oxidoreductase [Pseudomonadota bacterium]